MKLVENIVLVASNEKCEKCGKVSKYIHQNYNPKTDKTFGLKKCGKCCGF